MFAEYLVGGLTAGRLRQLAARVVAVHQMSTGAEFPEVHRGLVDVGVPEEQAFTITMRVFRSGGLTKDAVYLRGLARARRATSAPGGRLETLWLGKMPLAAVPLVDDLHQRGVLVDPLLVPRYLDHPARTSTSRGHPPGHFVGLTRRRSTVKIGFVINDIATEKPEYTTVRLALAAAATGPRDVAHGSRRLLPPPRRHGRRARSARAPGRTATRNRRSSSACRTTSTSASWSRSPTSTCS